MNGRAAHLPLWRVWRVRCLLVAAGGFLLLAVGGFYRPDRVLSAYLVGYLFALGIALGSLPLLTLHHLAGGGWGYLIRRILEAASRTWPLFVLLIVPLWLGVGGLYDWSATTAEAAEKLQWKQVYLNAPFFVVRSLLYFCVWGFMAHRLSAWSEAQDFSGDPLYTRRLRGVSGPFLILYSLTMTFAAFDWIMSLEPLWYSTIFGVVVMLGQILSALTFSLIVLSLVKSSDELRPIMAPKYLNDLGNMLLAFLMLWAYVHFSQYLIIWSGNISEEAAWYVHRMAGAWAAVAPLLALLHFAVPFFLLLQRSWKRRISRLIVIAGGLLALRLLEQIWLVEPSIGRFEPLMLLMDVAAAIGIGALFLSYFSREIAKMPLLPVKDPLLPGVMDRLAGQRVGDVV